RQAAPVRAGSRRFAAALNRCTARHSLASTPAMATELTELDFKAPLRNSWYHVMPSHRLKAGKMVGRVLLGEPVVIGRTNDGKVFGLRDICPHRALPLSCGRFDGKEITCNYHGWRFAPSGRCTLIPTLCEGQDFEPARIRTNAYEVREQQ